jgi:hypothetical protein
MMSGRLEHIMLHVPLLTMGLSSDMDFFVSSRFSLNHRTLVNLTRR